jgi:hypothetical protein
MLLIPYVGIHSDCQTFNQIHKHFIGSTDDILTHREADGSIGCSAGLSCQCTLWY